MSIPRMLSQRHGTLHLTLPYLTLSYLICCYSVRVCLCCIVLVFPRDNSKNVKSLAVVKLRGLGGLSPLLPFEPPAIV